MKGASFALAFLEGIELDKTDGVLKSKTLAEALDLGRMVKFDLWDFLHLVLDHGLVG